MYLLILFLFVWEPMRVAGEVAQSLPTMGMRGAPAAIELLAHALAAATAVAAAWSLWNGAHHGPALAIVALVLSAAVSVQSLYWSRRPNQTPPGVHLPLAAVAVVNAGVWIGYVIFRLKAEATRV